MTDLRKLAANRECQIRLDRDFLRGFMGKR